MLLENQPYIGASAVLKVYLGDTLLKDFAQQVNQYAVFDGVNDYMDGALLPLANQSFTVKIRSRRPVGGFSAHNILAVGNTGANNQYLHMGYESNGAPSLRFWNNDLTASSPDLRDGQFHELVFRFDAATKEQAIFVDGSLVASRTATSNFTGTSEVNVGRRTKSSIAYALADVDYIYVWGEAKSAAQLAGLNTDTTALLAKWELNGNGQDTSGNSRHLSVYGVQFV